MAPTLYSASTDHVHGQHLITLITSSNLTRLIPNLARRERPVNFTLQIWEESVQNMSSWAMKILPLFPMAKSACHLCWYAFDGDWYDTDGRAVAEIRFFRSVLPSRSPRGRSTRRKIILRQSYSANAKIAYLSRTFETSNYSLNNFSISCFWTNFTFGFWKR